MLIVASIALASEPSLPALTAERLPREPLERFVPGEGDGFGGDRVRLCWSGLAGDATELDLVVGPEHKVRRGEGRSLAEVDGPEGCWTGRFRERASYGLRGRHGDQDFPFALVADPVVLRLVDRMPSSPTLDGFTVTGLDTDDAGGIWIGTDGGGVSWHHPETGRWRSFRAADGLVHDHVTSVLWHEGELWVSTVGGVSRYDGAGFETVVRGLPAPSVYELAPGRDRLYAGTWRGGAAELVDGSWQAITLEGRWPYPSVTSLLEDSQGRLWLGTAERGVFLVDRARGEQTRFRTANGLAHTKIWDLLEAPDGAIWVATARGLSRHDPSTGSWQSWGQAEGLARDEVRSLAWSSDGLLVGTDRALYRMEDGQPVEVWSGDAEVLALVATGESFYAGLARERGVVEGLGRTPVAAPVAGPSLGDLAFVREDATGGVWYGGGSGVARQGPDGRWQSWDERDGLPGNRVTSFHQAEAGTIWVGTPEGVARFEGERWTTWRHAPGQAWNVQPLEPFFSDAAGRVWVASPDEVLVLDPADGSFTTGEGAAGTWRYVRLQGERAWLLGDGELVSFDPATGEGRSWELGDALDGRTVTAVHQDADGVVWMGVQPERAGRPGVLRLSGEGPPELADEVGSVWVKRIRTLGDQLWVVHVGGLSVREASGAWHRYGPDEGVEHVSDLVWLDGQLLATRSRRGLLRFDGSTWVDAHNDALDTHLLALDRGVLLAPPGVSAVRRGRHWVGLPESAVPLARVAADALELVDGRSVAVDLKLGPEADPAPPEALPPGEVAADGSVWWSLDAEGVLWRLDVRRGGEPLAVTELAPGAHALAVDGRGRVYVLVDGLLYDLDGRDRALGRAARQR